MTNSDTMQRKPKDGRSHRDVLQLKLVKGRTSDGSLPEIQVRRQPNLELAGSTAKTTRIALASVHPTRPTHVDYLLKWQSSTQPWKSPREVIAKSDAHLARFATFSSLLLSAPFRGGNQPDRNITSPNHHGKSDGSEDSPA